MPVDRSELALVWPRALFRAAAADLLTNPPLSYGDDGSATVGFLLDDAFHGGRGLAFFKDRAETPTFWPEPQWDQTSSFGDFPRARADLTLLRQLVAGLEQIPSYVPKRYYASRRRGPQPESPLDPAATRTEFAKVIAELHSSGYFDDALGSSCCDADGPQDGQGALQEMLALPGAPSLWPVTEETAAAWDEDTFLSYLG